MPAPSFRIDYSRDGDLLRAHVTGVNGTLETTLACWMALAAELRREPPGALLVVDDMEGEPPPPEQLAQFVQAMVGMGFEGVRVAYVEAHAEQIPEVEFGEILAIGRLPEERLEAFETHIGDLANALCRLAAACTDHRPNTDCLRRIAHVTLP